MSPSRKDCLHHFALYSRSSAYARVSNVLLHARHELSTAARLNWFRYPWLRCSCLTSAPADLQHLLLSPGPHHVVICSSLMYLAPSGFSGLEHPAPSCRSAFDHSFSFLRKFIHGSGLSRGRLAHPSQVFQKCFQAPIATLRGACHCFLAQLRERTQVLSTRTEQWEAIGVPVPPHRSCCHNPRICFSNPLSCACESALWRVYGCAARYVNF